METIPQNILDEIKVCSTPHPWQLQGPFAVGGLWAVGFRPDSDLLLVVSTNGLGVFDCLTGKRVARSEDDDDYDEQSETVTGIGPIGGLAIEVAGTGGGIVTRRTLPVTTSDGWTVGHAMMPTSPNEAVFLQNPSDHGTTGDYKKLVEVEEVRAIGFSPTGRSLVVAEPHTLHVWIR
jgi:hypothetical protein